MLPSDEITKIEQLCFENRQNILKMVYEAQSGHIGGSLSSCEIMTVLFHKCMNHALKGKDDKNYDLFCLKGMFLRYIIQFLRN